MRMMLAALALLLVATTARAEVDPKALSKELDELYRSKASEGKLTMKVRTPDYQRDMTMKIWSRGMDDTLVIISAPRKDAGTASLKRGSEMWNYLPKIKKTIRIPPSMMMGSWMGSDFTNDDLVRESSWEEDFDVSLEPSPPAGQVCLRYSPKPTAVITWSRVVTCFDAASRLPLTSDYYDEKDRKARRMTFSDVRVLGGRTLPCRMTMVPLTKEGHETTVIYDEMTFDGDVPDHLFTLTNLRRAN